MGSMKHTQNVWCMICKLVIILQQLQVSDTRAAPDQVLSIETVFDEAPQTVR